MNPELYDKRGIPIHPGDTVKIFHYVSAVRREKRSMYKHVMSLERVGAERLPALKVSHLSQNDTDFIVLCDGRVMEDWEIVQGYQGVKLGQDYRDRKRKEPSK